MKEKIMGIWEIILDILFPPVCLVCRRRLDINKSKFFRSQPIERINKLIQLKERNFPEARLEERAVAKGNSFPFLCPSCSQKIQINNTAFCPVCFARLPENKKICHFDSQFILAAAGSYEDENLRQLIALLKYQKVKTAAVSLAEILSRYIVSLREISQREKNFVIVPIPLHWRREKERGFNQSYLIADQLSKNSGLPVTKNILKRIKNTSSQVELKEKEKREINVQNCFALEKPELLSQKNVILLDDVFTSGATMKEAVKTIKKAGVRKIVGLVIAKA